MRVRVNFRVNTETGDVETFLIEDISTETEPEHDAAHDRLAYEVGKVVERRPRPEQVVGGTAHDELLLAYPDEEQERRKQAKPEQEAG
jgi:hypothetical protein